MSSCFSNTLLKRCFLLYCIAFISLLKISWLHLWETVAGLVCSLTLLFACLFPFNQGINPESLLHAKQVLYSGEYGDGKIFVYDVQNVIQVRTGKEGFDALQYPEIDK